MVIEVPNSGAGHHDAVADVEAILNAISNEHGSPARVIHLHLEGEMNEVGVRPLVQKLQNMGYDISPIDMDSRDVVVLVKR